MTTSCYKIKDITLITAIWISIYQIINNQIQTTIKIVILPSILL
jgi:hypothetical protein